YSSPTSVARNHLAAGNISKVTEDDRVNRVGNHMDRSIGKNRMEASRVGGTETLLSDVVVLVGAMAAEVGKGRATGFVGRRFRRARAHRVFIKAGGVALVILLLVL